MTVEEFLAVCATDPDRYKRFDLVGGVIWEPFPESIVDSEIIERIAQALRQRFEPAQKVRVSGSVQLGNDGLVLPDAYLLVPGAEPEGEYWQGHQLALAVEVGTTTWAKDIGPKLRNYARGGVPFYYVARPNESGGWTVRRFSRPEGDRYRYDQVVGLDRMFD